MQHSQEHRALRLLLWALAFVMLVGGLLLLFATSWLAQMVQPPSVGVSQAEVMLLLRAIGGIALTFSFLLYRAGRDPVRNVAIVDGLIVLLVVLTLVDIGAAVTGSVPSSYPASLVWPRIVLRMIIAAVVIALRPRGAV